MQSLTEGNRARRSRPVIKRATEERLALSASSALLATTVAEKRANYCSTPTTALITRR